MAQLGAQCQNLKRLKLRSCSHITEGSIEHIAQLKNLEHLSLSVAHTTSPQLLIELIKALGSNLRTLSLEDYVEIDDTVLEAIRAHCGSLIKLRMTGTSLCTDGGFASLFNNGALQTPLLFADLSSNRDVEGTHSDGTDSEDYGFGGEAFKALMHHSGRSIRKIDLHSNRHISYQALLDVFNGKKRYPELREMDLSFVTHVDDVVMNGIFRSCPALSKLAVFACFNARGAHIPPGLAVVGLPNAQDNIVINEHVLAKL